MIVITLLLLSYISVEVTSCCYFLLITTVHSFPYIRLLFFLNIIYLFNQLALLEQL